MPVQAYLSRQIVGHAHGIYLARAFLTATQLYIFISSYISVSNAKLRQAQLACSPRHMHRLRYLHPNEMRGQGIAATH